MNVEQGLNCSHSLALVLNYQLSQGDLDGAHFKMWPAGPSLGLWTYLRQVRSSRAFGIFHCEVFIFHMSFYLRKRFLFVVTT